MFKGIILFFLILIIILFPIPLKITLKYKNKVLEIYIYNKKIKSKTPLKANSDIKAKIISKENFFASFNFYDIRIIVNSIINLKFKPTIILNSKLEYGFEDAAFVAILFGLIHSAYGYFYLLIQNFAVIKKIDLKVIPHFKENDINLKISSIIYTNLGKIIYISFVMIICLIKIKHKKTKFKKYKGGSVHG